MQVRSSNDALTAGRLLGEQSRGETVLVALDAEGMALVPAGGKGKLLFARIADHAGAVSSMPGVKG